MAQEIKRGCGYRVVGGLYLCGEYREVYCDRLPYLLEACPVCGGGIKPTRSYLMINPLRLFGYHLIDRKVITGGYDKSTELRPTPCNDIAGCFLCQPREDPAFIVTIGDKFYTPDSFLDEARRLGISKRIPFIPKELKLGETRVYLAHRQAVSVPVPETLPLTNGSGKLEANRIERKFGIFSAFIPQRVEKLIWRHEADEKTIEDLKKRGITPVIIEAGDIDHANNNKRLPVLA